MSLPRRPRPCPPFAFCWIPAFLRDLRRQTCESPAMGTWFLHGHNRFRRPALSGCFLRTILKRGGDVKPLFLRDPCLVEKCRQRHPRVGRSPIPGRVEMQSEQGSSAAGGLLALPHTMWSPIGVALRRRAFGLRFANGGRWLGPLSCPHHPNPRSQPDPSGTKVRPPPHTHRYGGTVRDLHIPGF